MKRLNNLYYSKRIKELLAELQTAGTTLVVAPMGYGKTLAVQYFLQEQERCGKKVLRQSIYGAGAEASGRECATAGKIRSWVLR